MPSGTQSEALNTLRALGSEADRIERSLVKDAKEDGTNPIAWALLSLPHLPFCKVGAVRAAGERHLEFTGRLPDGSVAFIFQQASQATVVFQLDEAPPSQVPDQRVRLKVRMEEGESETTEV